MLRNKLRRESVPWSEREILPYVLWRRSYLERLRCGLDTAHTSIIGPTIHRVHKMQFV